MAATAFMVQPGALAGGEDAQPKASKHVSERQTQITRLINNHRDEAKQLLKELARHQGAWLQEQEGDGVLAGLPKPPPRQILWPVRRKVPWRHAEREVLKRQLMSLGIGRWKQLHASLAARMPGLRHGAGDVEDASWQLLGELQLWCTSASERLFLARLMEPLSGPVSTPGAPYRQLQAGARPLVRRLMLLEELNALLPALCRSEPVAGAFRQLAAGLPASEAPAAWWDVEADVALLVGASRHGFGNYEAIRRDLELEPAFQHKQRQLYHTEAAAGAPEGACGGCWERAQQLQAQQQHHMAVSPLRALLGHRHSASIGELYWRSLQQQQQHH